MSLAWADAFEPDRLGPAPALDLPVALTRAWAFGDGQGAGVKVAIVDSGVDADHPRVGGVAGGVVLTHDPDAPEGVHAEDGPHRDVYGHGTACAAIIRGLAPAAEIYSVRVLGERLTGKSHVFAAGIAWAIDRGMDVVNLSLSTSRLETIPMFAELCDEAAFGGLLLVSAMNNERKTTIPSEFSSVFSVASHPGSDPEQWSANPHPPAEWGAPGVDVEVAWLDGGTIVTDGNSFAAPHIAGHLARLKGAHPGITPWQAKTVLAALATNRRAP